VGSNAAFGIWNKADWAVMYKTIDQWSGYILATAMAGVGLSTSFECMRGMGMKPF